MEATAMNNKDEASFYRTDYWHPGLRGYPIFYPWLGISPFNKHAKESGCGPGNFRYYLLWAIAQQSLSLDSSAEIWECGVYKGVTACLLASIIKPSGAKLRLFDTFEGMPPTDPTIDAHKAGDFSDTSLEEVSRQVTQIYPVVDFRKGFIPDTFVGLEYCRISFAHIDVDIYSSVRDSLEFIFPRLIIGGAIIFDDYAWGSCKGARKAVDEFFRERIEIPVSLPSGQCFVIKVAN